MDTKLGAGIGGGPRRSTEVVLNEQCSTQADAGGRSLCATVGSPLQTPGRFSEQPDFGAKPPFQRPEEWSAALLALPDDGLDAGMARTTRRDGRGKETALSVDRRGLPRLVKLCHNPKSPFSERSGNQNQRLDVGIAPPMPIIRAERPWFRYICSPA